MQPQQEVFVLDLDLGDEEKILLQGIQYERSIIYHLNFRINVEAFFFLNETLIIDLDVD